MAINKIIIITVILCILLSTFTSGLTSAVLDLCAFALLLFYLFKQLTMKKK